MAADRPVFLNWPPLLGDTRALPTRFDLPGGGLKSKSCVGVPPSRQGVDWLIEMHNRSGLIGSLYYGSQLSEAEADRIRFYFNYDMIGSKQPIYAVYADTDAHKTGGSILFDYLQSKGKPVYYG